MVINKYIPSNRAQGPRDINTPRTRIANKMVINECIEPGSGCKDHGWVAIRLVHYGFYYLEAIN